MKAKSVLFVLLLTFADGVLVREQVFAESNLVTDIETDPLAFALGGYSLHAGVSKGHWRVDAGAFAMQLPEALHGNSNLNVGFHGYGLKLQYFLSDEQAGAFVGAGAGVNQLQVQHRRTRVTGTRSRLSAGVHGGWRFMLVKGLYATPWIGLDYTPANAPITVSGETFDNGRWSVFPTVHLGYRF